MKIAYFDASNKAMKWRCVDSKCRRRTIKIEHNFFLMLLRTFRDIHEKNMKNMKKYTCNKKTINNSKLTCHA